MEGCTQESRSPAVARHDLFAEGGEREAGGALVEVAVERSALRMSAICWTVRLPPS